MTEVYTATLGSALELTIPVRASFGEIMVAGILLVASAVLGLEFLVRLVYRK